MTDCDDPEFHYRFGIELFIAGVEAIAAWLSDGGAVGQRGSSEPTLREPAARARHGLCPLTSWAGMG
jgi:hypothetical protein